MIACDVVPYVDHPGLCNRCGVKLTGRRTRWCSSECERQWQINHYWTMARPAAVKRDGGICVSCGGDGAIRIWRRKVYVTDNYQMRQLGIEFTGNHREHHRTYLELVVRQPWLEVNHIEPRAGRGYQSGCHHHLTNLETLCHPCHVVETKRQGAKRRAAKRQQIELPL